jgi:hypothetical protein
VVTRHLDEAAVHRGFLFAGAREDDAHGIVRKRAQVGHVPVQERDRARHRAAHHHLRFALEQDGLG